MRLFSFPYSNEAHSFIASFGKSSHRSSIVDIYLLPFDEAQTTQYIATFAERFQDLFPGWTKPRYEQALKNFPGLQTFLSEPLLLFMVLNVLPLMSASVTGGGNDIGTHAVRLDPRTLGVEQLDSEDDKFAVFSRAELYSVFAYNWVCREVCRLGGDFVEKELDEIGNFKPKPEAVRSVLDFCQKLAFEMFLHNTGALELPPDTIGGPSAGGGCCRCIFVCVREAAKTAGGRKNPGRPTNLCAESLGKQLCDNGVSEFTLEEVRAKV